MRTTTCRAATRIGALVAVLAFAGAGAVGTLRATSASYTDDATAETGEIPADIPASVVAVRQANSLDTTAVVSEGRLYLWGFYSFGNVAGPGGGSLGVGYGTENAPALFPTLSTIVGVSANAYGYKALDADGRLWTWGTNGYYENGAVGAGLVTADWTPLDTEVVATAGAEYTNAWLKSDGTVWTTGSGAFGQRGTGNVNTSAQRLPTKVVFPAGTGRIVSLGGAYEGFYAIDDGGRVYFWGRDFRGGAGNGRKGDNYVLTPVAVPALTTLVQAEGVRYLGGGYAWGGLLTEAGNVYTWGSAENNSTGLTPGNWTEAQSRDVYVPRLFLTGVGDVTFSYQSGSALMADGTVWAWGENLWGGAFRLPDGSININNILAAVYDGALGPATSIGGTRDTSSYALQDGTVWTWGENGGGAACGGLTAAACPNSVDAVGASPGPLVWPPYRTELP